MGKMTIPKHSANKEDFTYALKIYYENKGWMDYREFVPKIKELIGGRDQGWEAYTKKSQIPKYFGFVTVKDITASSSPQRITTLGMLMYEALRDDDSNKIFESIMAALESGKFGRGNYGSPSCDSDIEPPILFLKSILDLDFITNNEFSYLLYNLDTSTEKTYENLIVEIKQSRISTTALPTDDIPNVYKDNKPMAFITNVGFLIADETIPTNGGKAIVLNATVKNKYETLIRSLNIYNDEISEDTAVMENVINYQTGYSSDYPRNRIIFGAPGTGKSYKLEKERDDLLIEENDYERVTFHPDYSYANFVGTYKPTPAYDEEGKEIITYKYVPGPFMRTLVAALKNGRTDNIKPYLLIVEEINRANVAAVFGDVFQLLDRKDNVSEYPIQTSEDMRKFLADELGGESSDYAEIKIPDNMFIWATMNSADQGVFPMDTAFKRRWDFSYLGINEGEEDIADKEFEVNDVPFCWNDLRVVINNRLLSYNINEDKLLGAHFITGECLDSNEAFIETFKNKVIMYLFEDAAKQHRPKLFEGCDVTTLYSAVCKDFDDRGLAIFGSDFLFELAKASADAPDDDTSDSIEE